MTLTKRNNNLFKGFPSIFDDFVTRDLFDWSLGNNSATGTSVPAVNIKETPDSYEVHVAAPGMTKNDFKVELNNNMLTISSEKEQQHEEKEGNKFTRREFSYQSFQRSFQLAKESVDADNIKARYENGVLELVIPKREEVKQKPTRLIEIA